jgi:uncharacterized RDD family membrane protein YckC
MARTNIITGQYVRIQQTAATVMQRFFAWVIDAIFLTIASTILFGITASIGTTYYTAGIVLGFFSAFIVLSCPLLMEMFVDGQTIGKSIMGIRVLCLDGSTPSKSAYMLRWLLYGIDFFCMGIGLAAIIFSKNSQRIGDLAAGTTVVKTVRGKRPFILNSFSFAQKGYVPNYPEAASLSMRQASVIGQALFNSNDVRRWQQLQQLSQKVEEYLGIRAKEPSAEHFLLSVYNDFQYYAMKMV